MPVENPRINGFIHDFSSLECKFDGLSYPQVKELNYKINRSGNKQYGAGPKPVGRTRGQYSFEASFTMYLWAWEDFKNSVLGGDGFMEKEFTWIVHYGENGLPTITDELQNCVIT